MADDNIIKNTFEYGDGLNLRCTYRAASVKIEIEQFDVEDNQTSPSLEIFLDLGSAEKLAHWLLGVRAMSN